MFRRAPRGKAKPRSLMSARTQLGRAAASSTERNCCGAAISAMHDFPGVGMTAVAVSGKTAIDRSGLTIKQRGPDASMKLSWAGDS
jgi:hypothetical protein